MRWMLLAVVLLFAGCADPPRPVSTPDAPDEERYNPALDDNEMEAPP